MRRIDRTGESELTVYGQKMTIIRYGNANDIDVKFEDGTIVRGKKYGHFKIGNIRNPNVEESLANERARQRHEGEVVVNRNGLRMTLMRYGTTKDCDIVFDDGVIVRNRYYGAFKNGDIAHPDNNRKNQRKYVIGDTNTALNGMEMKIIAYSSQSPGAVVVEFADGYQTTVSSGAFATGEVKNPNAGRVSKLASERIGQIFFCKNGLHLEITGYDGTHQVSGRFEDGEIVGRTSWNSIISGTVAHPSLSAQKHCVYKGITAKIAWQEEDKVYYTCRCEKCGKEAIWTPQEMIIHEKECKEKEQNS